MKAFIPVLGAIALLSLPAAGQAAGLGAAGDFNVFTLGSTTFTNTDVRGRLAGGGTVTLTNFAVGKDYAPGSDVLIAGGALSLTNGQVNNGNARSSGTYSATGVGIPNGTYLPGNPIDFTQAGNDLRALSTTLNGYTVNGNTGVSGNAITLTGADAGLNVFTLTTAQLATASSFTINVPTGATALVNVQGAAASFGNFQFYGVDAARTLFNFAGAGSLSTHSLGFKGSLLAPNASVFLDYGHIDGQLITGTLNSYTEAHNVVFQGTLTPPPGGGGTGSAIPEPGSMALLAMGALPALPLLRRRRRA